MLVAALHAFLDCSSIVRLLPISSVLESLECLVSQCPLAPALVAWCYGAYPAWHLLVLIFTAGSIME